MRVLITGSSGYLGKNVARYFIKKNIKVAGIDVVDNSGIKTGKLYSFHKCSVTDFEKLRKIFNDEQPTHVIHLASTLNKFRNVRMETESDIGGSLNILRLSEETRSVKQLIFSSSATVYGGHRSNKLWLKESDNADPGKYRYGINKLRVEREYISYRKRDDMHIVILRICLIVGKAYDRPGSIVSLLLKINNIPKFFMNNKIQFLHVEDITELFHLIAQDEEIEGIFNMSPDSYSIVNKILTGKRYVLFPPILFRTILWVLWNLKLLNLQPAGVNISLYPVIIDPSSLVSRYGYKFRYSSDEAFLDTIRNHRLLSDSRF